MTQEIERLKTELLAAEVEIARLQSAFDELKKKCEITLSEDTYNEFGEGFDSAMDFVLKGINRITGTDK